MKILELGCKIKPGELVRHKKYIEWTGQIIELKRGLPSEWSWWSEEIWQFWRYYNWLVIKFEDDSTLTNLPIFWEVIPEKAKP